MRHREREHVLHLVARLEGKGRGRLGQEGRAIVKATASQNRPAASFGGVACSKA